MPKRGWGLAMEGLRGEGGDGAPTRIRDVCRGQARPGSPRRRPKRLGNAPQVFTQYPLQPRVGPEFTKPHVRSVHPRPGDRLAKGAIERLARLARERLRRLPARVTREPGVFGIDRVGLEKAQVELLEVADLAGRLGPLLERLIGRPLDPEAVDLQELVRSAQSGAGDRI